jgi:hypothetical protein
VPEGDLEVWHRGIKLLRHRWPRKVGNDKPGQPCQGLDRLYEIAALWSVKLKDDDSSIPLIGSDGLQQFKATIAEAP